jgi:hypothetical protein
MDVLPHFFLLVTLIVAGTVIALALLVALYREKARIARGVTVTPEARPCPEADEERKRAQLRALPDYTFRNGAPAWCWDVRWNVSDADVHPRSADGRHITCGQIGNDECSLCMERYVTGDLICALPCQHFFHRFWCTGHCTPPR